VIQFLNSKNTHTVQIHRHNVGVYGEGAMNKGNVWKWCRLLKEDDMLFTLNNKFIVCGIFCDLEKAFEYY
jgi:hypothetical protein